jgi:hypothetical protein
MRSKGCYHDPFSAFDHFDARSRPPRRGEATTGATRRVRYCAESAASMVRRGVSQWAGWGRCVDQVVVSVAGELCGVRVASATLTPHTITVAGFRRASLARKGGLAAAYGRFGRHVGAAATYRRRRNVAPCLRQPMSSWEVRGRAGRDITAPGALHSGFSTELGVGHPLPGVPESFTVDLHIRVVSLG